METYLKHIDIDLFVADRDWNDWIEWFIGSLSLEQQQQIHNLLHREGV